MKNLCLHTNVYFPIALKSLQELLNRVNNADSGLLIEKSGAVIVDRIHKTRERRKKITAEEMNAVIEERDAAISKVSLVKFRFVTCTNSKVLWIKHRLGQTITYCKCLDKESCLQLF